MGKGNETVRKQCQQREEAEGCSINRRGIAVTDHEVLRTTDLYSTYTVTVCSALIRSLPSLFLPSLN